MQESQELNVEISQDDILHGFKVIFELVKSDIEKISDEEEKEKYLVGMLHGIAMFLGSSIKTLSGDEEFSRLNTINLMESFKLAYSISGNEIEELEE